jgi:hypothetical protein
MRRSTLALVFAVIASLVLGTVAMAVPVTPIDNAELNGSGDRVWDPLNDSGGCLHDDTVYTPVDDGSTGLQTDAFDGGLTLIVDGKGFADADDTGNEVGEQLTVGPTTFHGVAVLRQDRAIGRSLRSLIKFTNTRAFAQTLEVYFDSDLGSDDSGEIRATSTGDLQVTRADRWFVTSDDATTPSDPVLTFVTHGKGSIRSRADSPAFGDLTECVVTHWTVRVPGHSVRYLLVFAEMNPTNEVALNNVGKWNSQKLNATLLDDIGANAKAKVVNWDLI